MTMETDFVDEAVDDWAREVPELETSCVGITGRIERISRLLDRKVTDALADPGISSRDLEVLGALRRSGPPYGMPASQLAKAAMFTSGGMTGEADRLANAGLVIRRPDPQDRRTVLVTLTPQGNDMVERGLEAYLDASQDALQVLDRDEQRSLCNLLRKLLVSLEGNLEAGKQPGDSAPEGEQPKTGRRDKPRPVSRFEAAS